MSTVSDIITRAGRALGYLGRTEVLSAGDATDGLSCFNEMLQSWSNESFMSYLTLQRSFALVSGTQSYTIGSGGTINTTRPYNIISAFVRDNDNNDYPMRVIGRNEWDNIGTKDVTSQIPDTLFYSAEYPLGIIYIFPIPLMAYNVFYNTTQDQAVYTSVTTAISMPVGYESAFIFNLALHMMSYGFPCMLSDREYGRLMENAAQTKGNLKRVNDKHEPALYDSAIVSKSDATYNIYTDSYPRAS